MQPSKNVKGVIFAAGYGTRFLPATKTLPKELFPLIDTPAIEFTIREFLDSGIQDILIVTSRRKKVFEDYFDREVELETLFKEEGKTDKLSKIAPAEANFHFLRQREMKGTADALKLCKTFCGSSPFVVAYPDDLFFSETSCAKQLIDAYRKTGKTVLTVKELPNEDVSRYGVIDYSQKDGNIYSVSKIVEKPAKGTEPSKFVSFGRYLYTPDIFDALDQIKENPNVREISQTEPLNYLSGKGEVAALDFEGVRHDVGEPLGYLTTILEYGITRKDLSGPLKEYLKANYDRLIS
ncbi:MAG: UTP--glucose-1-phosphate uridylyltransferase [Candidatus Caenarcaniphilales bacterium]|nr:UTP--glucose-1-phosphate uridylyltransferase [Candidatus Caenarcaniphilales bacterium]